ncbi:hypothetical protein HDU77_011552 [Chytriomyces hyalinus]|nr:hypothetical protein HDU77_011552 [Chytriomyces hyalinus]
MRMAARASNCVTQHDSPSVDLARDSLHTLMDEAFGGKTLAHVVTREDLFVHGRYDVDYQDADVREDYGPDDLYTPYCPTSHYLSDSSSEIDALFDDVMDDSDLDNEIELACRELVTSAPPLGNNNLASANIPHPLSFLELRISGASKC